MRILKVAALLAAGVLAAWSSIAVAEAQPPCADFGGTVDNAQTCRVHVSKPAYLLDMSFPVDYPDEQELTDYLTQTRDGFVNVAEMPGSRDVPYALDAAATRYGSGTPPRGTQSVVVKVYQSVGGAHPLTWYKTFNYDLAKGAPITLNTLFVPGGKPFEVIFPIVQRDVQKQLGTDVPISPGGGLDPSNYQNFAITDDALIFFFSQGELLPEAAGAMEVSVPRAAVASMLAPGL